MINKYNIKEEKNRIRSLYKEKRSAIPRDMKQIMDSAICKRFLSLSSYRFADTIIALAKDRLIVAAYPYREKAEYHLGGYGSRQDSHQCQQHQHRCK